MEEEGRGRREGPMRKDFFHHDREGGAGGERGGAFGRAVSDADPFPRWPHWTVSPDYTPSPTPPPPHPFLRSAYFQI